MSTLKTKPIARTIESNRSSALTWTLLIMTAVLLTVLALGAERAIGQDETLVESMDRGWQGYEEQPLRVNVWHDQDDEDVYRKGESVRVHFEANHDAYAVIYRIDAAGEVSILWPRSRFDDGFIFANHTYNLPSPGGRRIRAAGEEGVEYVQAIVSAYPFDVRGLDIDFMHEAEEVPRSYYVAGDPFLAMNDINFEVTGLEDTEDFVATNYTSWYVGRRVEHPRYLCSQCHSDDMDRHPYRDTCSIEIHHDYGWTNDWYASYGYYPVYYNPVYYYVDPWTSRPWVNYWYRPWYRWPSVTYGWGFDRYVWNYSPYGYGDVWTSYNSGHRRYRPLGKGVRYKAVKDGTDYRNPRGLVKSPRPSKDMRTAMENRTRPASRVKGSDGTLARPDRSGFSNVGRTKREQQSLTRPIQREQRTGIRVPDRTRYPNTIGSGAVRSRTESVPQIRNTTGSRVRSEDRKETGSERQVRPNTQRSRTQEPTRVRPVEPRSKGSRIWQGGSTNNQNERAVKPVSPGTKNRSSRTPAVRPRTNTKPSTPRPAVKPTTRSKERSPSSTPKVRTRSNSSSSSKGTTTRSQSGSSKSGGSKSSGSSKSGSSKTRNR